MTQPEFEFWDPMLQREYLTSAGCPLASTYAPCMAHTPKYKYINVNLKALKYPNKIKKLNHVYI